MREERDREAIGRLARSEDARRLVAMLQKRGGVQEAARAAAGGDAGELMSMMDQLMRSKEGAELVERLQRRAREEGLT